MLRSLADQGMSILFSSTDLDEVLGFGERVLLFYNGALIRTAATADLSREALASAITHGGAHD